MHRFDPRAQPRGSDIGLTLSTRATLERRAHASLRMDTRERHTERRWTSGAILEPSHFGADRSRSSRSLERLDHPRRVDGAMTPSAVKKADSGVYARRPTVLI